MASYKKTKIDEEANDRLAECRTQKVQFERDYREGYFFTAPERMRNILSSTPPTTTRMRDEAELQTSLAFELAQDFVTVVLNTFMPESQPWCERRAGMFVSEDAWKEVEDKVRADDLKIFSAMKASNLYPEVAKSFYPDLALGTVGLWIEDPRPAENIVVSAVPIREMEINLGPFGEVDDRFVVRWTKNRYVRALLPGVTIPQDLLDAIDKKPSEQTEIRWGFWRLWDRRDDEVWKHIVMYRDRVIHETEIKGEGCCPLIVGRFNPSADWVYGTGPLMKCLPDLRQVDELQGQKISHIELLLTPPMGIPDDSFAAVEGGLEAGMAYPIRSGSEGAIKKLYDPGPADSAVYLTTEFEKRLRKLHFVDFPEQRGDTPPTATQWLDEMQMAQRRIGTPGLPFWREVPAKIFLRFQYLLQKAGTIEEIKVNGKHVSLQAYNPAQRAAEQQDIAMSARYIEMMAQAFPEEWKVQVDGKKTMANFKTKMRETLVEFRQSDDIKKAVDLIAPLVKGQAGSANPAAATGLA